MRCSPKSSVSHPHVGTGKSVSLPVCAVGYGRQTGARALLVLLLPVYPVAFGKSLYSPLQLQPEHGSMYCQAFCN